MNKRAIFRGTLLTAGLLAALVIVLSHSFRPVEVKNASTELTEHPADQTTVISAPSEAITQASVIKIDEQVPDSLLQIFEVSDCIVRFVPVTEKLVSHFFEVLFHFVIAPNAP
jgi:hypothetical protein